MSSFDCSIFFDELLELRVYCVVIFLPFHGILPLALHGSVYTFNKKLILPKLLSNSK